MDLAQGTRLGRYEIRAKIGAGGMGEVFLAQDTKLDRKVALKILPVEVAANHERMRRFVQEARAASALNHPNIITIYEIEDSATSPFIAMEFIDGETLRARLNHTTLKVSEAVDIAIQTASALAAAHDAGIVHRDIKPENIMLRRDGYVKVFDFGLAKLAERRLSLIDTKAATLPMVDTDPGTVVGTASYMSPEQARGQVVDQRTDIWSLGVVLYEMISGHIAFSGATSSHVIVSILEKEPPPLSRYVLGVPEGLELIVAQALAKVPDERWQTAKQLLSSLKRVKQRLDSEAEINRSTAPEMLGRKPSSPGSAASADKKDTFEQPTIVSSVVSTTPANLTSPAMSSAEYVVHQIKRHKKAVMIGAGLSGIVLVTLILGLYRFISQRPSNSEGTIAPPQNMKFTKLSVSGATLWARISPDGRYLVRVLTEAGKKSLRLRQVATTSETEIIAPAAVEYREAIFSPDMNYIYYIAQPEGENLAALYRVSLLGGDPQKVVSDLDGPLTLSPGGDRIAFVRNSPQTNESTIFVARSDGSSEQALLVSKSPLTIRNISWSPDGSVIAYVVFGQDKDGYFLNVEAVNVNDRSTAVISPARWRMIWSLVWLSDMSGMLVSGRDRASLPSTPEQIWFIGYPDGSARKVTNDANAYRDLSLTADSHRILAGQYQNFSTIWVTPGGDLAQARQMTADSNSGKLSWTPEGRIAYDSMMSGNADIWVANADGSAPKQLTFDPLSDIYPTVSPDGHYVVFATNRSVGWSLWRINSDGSNPKELVRNIRQRPANLSPDSRWVYFIALDSSGNDAVWKVPIDNGEPVKLTDKSAFSPSVSPDGQRFAAFYYEPGTGHPLKILIFPADGGEALRTLDAPEETESSVLNWAPDGRAIDCVVTHDGVGNVWRLPLDGGKARAVTNWKSDLINWFDWSRDGKRLAVSRQTSKTELVLIENFR